MLPSRLNKALSKVAPVPPSRETKSSISATSSSSVSITSCVASRSSFFVDVKLKSSKPYGSFD